MNKPSPPLNARVSEALDVLQKLGFPRAQLNERSALTLLALLDIQMETPWHEASNPLRGIVPMMDFFLKYYGKRYEENTRETVRRQTIHQFLQAGLIVINPDHPIRPTNSPKTVYQVSPDALALLRRYGAEQWESSLASYLETVETLKAHYAQERLMARIPVTVGGQKITLSPGGQNVLIEQIIEEFASRFTPGGSILYVGDAEAKFAYYDKDKFQILGVSVESHGKMPDVVIYYERQDWLVLIEAVTSHGPVNPKRRRELRELFSAYEDRLVFVTTFLTRRAMTKHLAEISWETEVWVADAPSHLIHFDGERFLGPY